MKKVYTKVISIVGNVITVKAKGASYYELAQIKTQRGISLAQVIKLDGEIVSLQVFAGSRGISTNDEVVFLGHP
ncbi:MAG: V-type ATP synthase subunit B, partial [Candidatus Omnitrophica bacterium]|nr:V-type ATP synthase subunit B [Candidatus Omnitrophota bacterium]